MLTRTALTTIFCMQRKRFPRHIFLIIKFFSALKIYSDVQTINNQRKIKYLEIEICECWAIGPICRIYEIFLTEVSIGEWLKIWRSPISFLAPSGHLCRITIRELNETFPFTGEYIQLPLQLEEILQDALQLADLTSDDQVNASVVTNIWSKHKLTCFVVQQNDTFSTKVDESATSDNSSQDKETGTSDATISDIDLSADLSNINLDDASELEELEMMIQSSSPFQHSRTGQNYGHGANSFRQSYHHQVSWSFFFHFVLLRSFSLPFFIFVLMTWLVNGKRKNNFYCAISDNHRNIPSYSNQFVRFFLLLLLLVPFTWRWIKVNFNFVIKSSVSYWKINTAYGWKYNFHQNWTLDTVTKNWQHHF